VFKPAGQPRHDTGCSLATQRAHTRQDRLGLSLSRGKCDIELVQFFFKPRRHRLFQSILRLTLGEICTAWNAVRLLTKLSAESHDANSPIETSSGRTAQVT